MKINSFIASLLTLIVVLGFVSCENDVELFGDIAERPVIFGLISSTDSVQYLRVERSFADPATSAVTLAKDENAVYYDDIKVELVDQDDQSRYELTRVNAVDEGYVRKDGDFLTDPNYVYRIASVDLPLTPDLNYGLEVFKSDNMIASSSTTILNDSKFFSPAVSGGIARIGFTNGKVTKVRWRRVPGASNYTISFDMWVRERNIVTGTQDDVMFRWDATGLIADDQSTSQSQETQIDGISFFNAIQSNLDPEQDITRQFIQLNIRVTTFGGEVGSYLEVINANSGITSAQEVPTFTNIEGGLGLFSSTTETVLPDLALSVTTLDSLYAGSVTGDLSFTP